MCFKQVKGPGLNSLLNTQECDASTWVMEDQVMAPPTYSFIGFSFGVSFSLLFMVPHYWIRTTQYIYICLFYRNGHMLKEKNWSTLATRPFLWPL